MNRPRPPRRGAATLGNVAVPGLLTLASLQAAVREARARSRNQRRQRK